MPIPLQAEAALAARMHGQRRIARTVRVVFRSSDGSVGKRDYLTHWIHSYPAKMFHRIPQVILNRLPSKPTLQILDPFCGSGTVLLEAIARGHHAIGIDVNPMARLIARVKVTPICPSHLRSHLAGILERARMDRDLQPNPTLDYWFKPGPRRALEAIEASIRKMRHQECLDFFLVCLSSIIRKCSLADPTIPPPVKLNQARAKVANLRYKTNLRHCQNLKAEDVFRLFSISVERNIRRMDVLFKLDGLGTASVVGEHHQASLSGLNRASIDLIITSPPYCGAQKYVRSVRLELLLLGHSTEAISEADRRTLGTERLSKKAWTTSFTGSPLATRLYKQIVRKNITRANIYAQYVTYLEAFAKEVSRVLKPTGEAFVTFGTDVVARVRVDCAKLFAEAAQREGMSHVATLIDTIPSRGMITSRHSSAATIKDERVVWLKR